MRSSHQQIQKSTNFSPSVSQVNKLETRPFANLEDQNDYQESQPSTATGLSWSFGDISVSRNDLSTETNQHSSEVAISRTNPLPIQAKLTIGQPGDKYEQEADRVAVQVVNQIHAPTTQPKESNPAIQGLEEQEEELQAKQEMTVLQPMEEQEEELQAKPSMSELQMSPLSLEVQRETMPEEEEIQAKHTIQRGSAGGEASTDLESAINSARGGGQPLDSGLQHSIGRAMGADFSGVKVHTDNQADQLNQSIQARAFTTGQDVFFRQGEYNPGSRGGQELIAHELTHVVQQSGVELNRSMSPQTYALVQEKENHSIIQCGQSMSTQQMPTVELRAKQPIFEDGKSFALVEAEATLTDISQRVFYEIRWDAKVVPGGNHLKQQHGQASDWVEDLSPQSTSIGNRKSPDHKYFNDKNEVDSNGLEFRFTDGIEQMGELNGGVWGFRLRVVDAQNKTLAKKEVKVDWNH